MGEEKGGCLEFGDDYCGVTSPDRPICHTDLGDCVECQFDAHCGTGNCVGAKCLPSDWECIDSEDCMSDRFKCVRHECVKKLCSDYANPDAFCEESRSGWHCLIGEGRCVACLEDSDCSGERYCVENKCVEKLCSDYKQPDVWCRLKYGMEFRCIDGKCTDTGPPVSCSDFLSTAEADGFCASNYLNKPYCDFGSGTCLECFLEQHCPAFWVCWNSECVECRSDANCGYGYKCTLGPDWKCIRQTCADASNPDAHCRLEHGEGYVCKGGECVSSGCDDTDSKCPEGFYCSGNVCVSGCRDSENCPGARPWCSMLSGSCEECLKRDHCEAGYNCIENVCVREEDCRRDDSACDKNYYCNVHTCEEGCRDDGNCGAGTAHCSQATGKCEECVFTVHCEKGYECKSYKCVWVGYSCDKDSDCPVNWMCHDQTRECLFGCRNNLNCGSETPNCSQQTGGCEECWSSLHCESWQECSADFRCVAKQGLEECKEGETKRGYRCRNGVWVEIECDDSAGCLGDEYCDDGICVKKQHECESNSECSSGYYCNDATKSCEEQRCRNHEDCPSGEGCDYQNIPSGIRDNEETHCISWREFQCTDDDPCPYPWVCDVNGLCVEKLCDRDSDCPTGYKCKENLCIARTCSDEEDPQGFCMKEQGWYSRCLNDECVLLACSSYSDADMMCMETKGRSHRCVNGECVDLGPNALMNPTEYCVELLGVDEAYWDYDKRSCEVPGCSSVLDPDLLCAQLKDPSYRCRDGECRHGREGEDCGDSGECMLGLRCKSGICRKKECLEDRDCDRETEWCSEGVCLPLHKTCVDDSECSEDYHCDQTGHCRPDRCSTHYDCRSGECCTDDGECKPCGEFLCFADFDCRYGWRCDTKTNKCVSSECERGSDCDKGYYCDLDTGTCVKIEGEGCTKDSDCPSGQVCKGNAILSPANFLWPSGTYTRKGVCVNKDEQVIVIMGIEDRNTCNYCRGMWAMSGREGFPLPPYHESCRCWAVYEDD